MNKISPLATSLQKTIKSIPDQIYWFGRKVVCLSVPIINYTIYLCTVLRNPGYRLLKWSIINNHENLSKIFMKIVVDVNQHGDDEISILQLASFRKQSEIVRRLIKTKGVDPDQECGLLKYTSLFWAIREGDPVTITALLDEGANINKTSNEKTPLLHALNEDKEDIATLLLQRNCDPNAGEKNSYSPGNNKNSSKKSPLYIYSNNNPTISHAKRKKFMEFLLKNHADSNQGLENIQEKYTTTTPLVDLMNMKPNQSDPNEVLIEKTVRTETPLYRAIESLDKQNMDTSIIELLLNHGADPNKGRIELLQNKPNNKITNQHTTPLAIATTNNFTEVVKLLLDKGANPNIKAFANDDPQWPLYVAVKNRNSEIVKLLLKKGADAKTKGQQLIWASGNHLHIKNLLKQYGAIDQGIPEPNFWIWRDQL